MPLPIKSNKHIYDYKIATILLSNKLMKFCPILSFDKNIITYVPKITLSLQARTDPRKTKISTKITLHLDPI